MGPLRSLLAWSPLVLGAGAFLVTVAVAPATASLGFYEAASQVIPILLLTLAVEIRLLGIRGIWRDPFSDFDSDTVELRGVLDEINKRIREREELVREVKGADDALRQVEEEAPPSLKEKAAWVAAQLPEIEQGVDRLRVEVTSIQGALNKTRKRARWLSAMYRFDGAMRAIYAVTTATVLAGAEVVALVALAKAPEALARPVAAYVLGAIVFGLVVIVAAALRGPAVRD